ncbi:TIGR02677 family protein [Kribbella solani]|uniref:TIGR02677 family protein n=1 Tax=Kribbella solani TaxID=236067 RepID=UPI0029A2116F|nr:TIGR02677 family protein [Kribbella solani]MDX2971357.1 TIGR02677 family protein [Kribbella solani]
MGAGSEDGADEIVTGTRSDLFRYLTAKRSEEYRAIVDLFARRLLADLSPAEVAEELRTAGIALTDDEVYQRCEKLEKWGNLLRGVRDTRATSVRDYHRGRSRFHASKLGGRLHRVAEEILAAGDGVQEVARELLGGIAASLERILTALAVPGTPDAEQIATEVTSVFTNQGVFDESVKEFYRYLNQILTRYDLAGEEYTQFKTMLLEYIELITADVSRYEPVVLERLKQVRAQSDRLIGVLASLPGLITPEGGQAERQPGRTAAEWAQLVAWYDGSHGRSGPETLRSAADQALRQLLANTKRMLAAAGTGLSRRADLLKLASWFDQADADTAHRLYAAAFGAYPARHLLAGPEQPNVVDGPSTSWWDAERVDVAISLRERGDRTARGRNSAVPDPGLTRQRLLEEAEREHDRRRLAASELVAAGDLHGAYLSPAARDLVLEYLARLLAMYRVIEKGALVMDADLALEVEFSPTAGRTMIKAPDGDLVIHGLRVTVAGFGVARSEEGTR